MKITKDTRLSFQVETDSHGVVLIHSVHIGRETFGLYYAELGAVFNACYGDDDEARHLALVGPRIAYFALEGAARKMRTWEGPSGVELGLVGEIVRLTMVSHTVPEGGWKTLPMHEARKRGILDDDAEEEVLSSLVFFTAACRAGSRKLVDSMLPVIGDALGWEYGFSSPTAFIDSLTKSTLEDHTHTGEPNSTPQSGKPSSITA